MSFIERGSVIFTPSCYSSLWAHIGEQSGIYDHTHKFVLCRISRRKMEAHWESLGLVTDQYSHTGMPQNKLGMVLSVVLSCPCCSLSCICFQLTLSKKDPCCFPATNWNKSTIWSNINGIWWQPSTSCTANSKPNIMFVNVLRCQGPLLDRLTWTYIRTKHAVAIQPVGELSNGWFYWRGQLTFSPTPLKETSDHYCQPQLSTLNGYWAVWWGLWECVRVCVWNLC